MPNRRNRKPSRKEPSQLESDCLDPSTMSSQTNKTYLTGLAEARSYYSLKDDTFDCDCGITFSWTKVPRLAMLDQIDLFNDIPKKGSTVSPQTFTKIVSKFQLLKNDGDIPVEYEVKDFEQSMADYHNYQKDIAVLKTEVEAVKRIAQNYQVVVNSQRSFQAYINLDVSSIQKAQKDMKSLKMLTYDGNMHQHIKNVRGATQRNKNGHNRVGYYHYNGARAQYAYNDNGDINFENNRP